MCLFLSPTLEAYAHGTDNSRELPQWQTTSVAGGRHAQPLFMASGESTCAFCVLAWLRLGLRLGTPTFSQCVYVHPTFPGSACRRGVNRVHRGPGGVMEEDHS
jgi:hypothetical protein